MLSPAFDTAAYLPIPTPLLPAPSLSPSLSTSPKPSSSALRIPKSPNTPRAACATPRATSRLSAAILSASPYFSPSNPFSARREPGALSARYTIINTLNSPGCSGTPSSRDSRAGCRTLRQRGRAEGEKGTSSFHPLSLGASLSAPATEGENEKRDESEETVLGLIGWVVLGMVFSLCLLGLRGRMEGTSGLGGVGTVHHVSWDIQARAVDDVWASRTGMGSQVEEELGMKLEGIWANQYY